MSDGKFEIVVELTPPILFTVGKSAVPPKSLVNLIFPLVEAVASGVAEALMPDCTLDDTIFCTKAVVAICVLFVPSCGVGAVGVPVKEGDAIVALKAMALVFAVILAVFVVTLVSNAVILAVFAAILVCNAVILAVLEAILFVLEVIFVVFVEILLVFVAIFEVFAAMLAAFVAILFVFAVMLAVLAATDVCSEVILEVFAVTVVCNVVILEVFAAIFAVFAAILFVFVTILEVFAVILAVLEAIKVGKPAIVEELTPPTLFTVGAAAVPPKSFVN